MNEIRCHKCGLPIHLDKNSTLDPGDFGVWRTNGGVYMCGAPATSGVVGHVPLYAQDGI